MPRKIIAVILLLAGCSSQTQKPHVDIPKAARDNVQLGLMYLEKNDRERAKNKLMHALQLNPKLPEAHSALAYYYEKTGEFDKAEQQHQEAIRFNQKDARAYNNYGTFLCHQGRFEEADFNFQKALRDETFEAPAEILENRGLCQKQAGNLPQAFSAFEEAVKRDPQRATSLHELELMKWSKQNNG